MPRIQRILVALDASPHSLSGLREALRIARGLGAEVSAVFVEDTALLRTAALPVAQHLRVATATVERLDPTSMERSMRIHAERIRRTVETTAAEYRVNASLTVVRGDVTSELVAASRRADLVVLGKAGAHTALKTLRRSIAFKVASSASSAVMLVLGEVAGCGPVAVLFDDVSATEALRTATSLAAADVEPLTVVVPALDREQAAALREAAKSALEDSGLALRFVEVARLSTASLHRAMQPMHGQTLVVDSRSPLAAEAFVRRMLNRLGWTVVIAPRR